ncbi:hypothetical protein BGZ70_004007 [Mortierella alpina]|uniref:Uncharacterized protein n=1 Tax=Mortierella alpina TaxID=64518 RepID=A0A9P6JAN3_MORAP|nr:hypothetical protein BGZ70_004007 [Mortierella alpina]
MKAEPGSGSRTLTERDDERFNHSDQESPATPSDDLDDPMDYTDETPVHPLAPAPVTSSPTSPANPAASCQSSAIQPQQHQQLLKLKTEHGVPPMSPSPISAPDIVMNNNEPEGYTPYPSTGAARRASHDATMGSSEATLGDANQFQHPQNPHLPSHEKSHLVVDTSAQGIRHHTMAPNGSSTPSSAITTDTPMTAGPTAPSSRRGSLRTMTATLPRSALQEETIALFKQYRNLIPCAKCFCRNTIQRDGMSDGNLRFKCRPPVSMSLICNKSYSESKIRNMIAGVVYGHSLPDSATPNSAASPGDNVLALAPPPNVTNKGPRRASTKPENSPRLGSDMGAPERLQRLQEDQEFRPHDQGRDPSREGSFHMERDSEGSHLSEARRQSHPYMHPQGLGRRASVQQLRRPSLAGDDSMGMEYEDTSAHGHHHGGSHLQVPGTPPLENEDPRGYRSRPSFGGHTARSVTPTPVHPHPSHQAQPGGRQGGQKLHHSHSHPNIGQVRQQYLEQQERERDHRGGSNNIGYSGSQQQQQQRPLQRQIVRRESTQYLGSAAERRSSQPSPVPGSKYHSSNEALSPALSSASPRPSPGREIIMHHDQQPGTPSSLRGRYDESSNATGYFQRRMSQPHTSHSGAYSGHAGLPPPLPSPLSHPYDRRASEAEEYTQMHREKYEKLNASTLLAPGSSASSAGQRHPSHAQHRQHRPHHPVLPPPGSPNGHERQHPMDGPDPAEDPSRLALTPPMRSSHLVQGHSPSTSSAPWSNGASERQGTPPHQGLPTPQAEPMRYSHSLPMGGPHRPPLRQHQSSSNLYYQTPRPENHNTFDTDNDRELSPDYHVDSDGRPVAKMRPLGLKRKSLGPAMRRSNSSQNLYSTSQQQQGLSHHQQQQQEYHHHHSHYSPNNIKLTCFPKNPSKNPSSATVQTLETSQATAMQVSHSSKIVIEIRQPRSLQSYASATNLREQLKRSASDDDETHAVHAHGRTLHRATSHPNLSLAHSPSSVLGHRRSASPDEMDFGASKKRRADTEVVAAGDKDEDGRVTCKTAASVATVKGEGLGSAVQVFGMDYLARSGAESCANKVEGLGLGLGLAATSPDVEALGVAKASSYVVLEDQKEMGIDYSLFTRVETAGWRILIPPNVVASFRSEDFGLMLKPKGLEEVEELDGQDSGHEEEGAMESEEKVNEMQELGDKQVSEPEEDDEDVNVMGVSRIAIRDDDKDEVEEFNTKTVRDLNMHVEAGQGDASKSGSLDHPDGIEAVEMDEEQGDVEMDREQDELLEDDD